MPSAGHRVPVYRLRGTVAGVETAIDLAAGRHIVGSLPETDVTLPVPGVSRRHARLTVASGSLVVEDLESTNGTLVDGRRVDRGGVAVGAELAFGPVRLKVEGVASDDAELAIVLEGARLPAAPPAVLSSFNPEETTLVLGDEGRAPAGLWLKWLEGFLERLTATPEGDAAAALGFLGQCLGASGCCLVRWTEEGREVALAAWGSMHQVPPLGEVRRLVAAGPSGCAAAFFATDPLLSAAFSTRRGPEPLGLVVWGDFPDRLASAGLLRTLVLLCEDHGPARAPGAPSEARPRAAPALVFPAGYRPGTSPPMVALYAQMERLLRGALPVLISGETGVGKERVARILHASSERKDGPFVAVNCAAIPNELLEAEMFGVGKGVATGVEARPGRFQLAQGGTLFLDEIGELAPGLQAKLLRALEAREVQPLGSRPVAVDVRVVAATNVDLARHLEGGALRSDLFYRLAGFILEVPPLRRCPEDIPGLVEHFLRRAAEESGTRPRGVTVAALRLLTSYPWPGNVRELEHEIRRLAYGARDGEVLGSERLSERLSARLRRPGGRADPVAGLVAGLDSLALAPAVASLEAELIREALARSGGKKVEACRLLGLSRTGLDKKVKRLEIGLTPRPPARVGEG